MGLPAMKQQRIGEFSFKLAGRSVHLWSIRTQSSSAVRTQFERVLSPDERSRTARLRFDHLRQSFVVARGALRVLLGRYLDMSPMEIQFEYSSHAKPALRAPASIDFSVSHSGVFAVFGFTLSCELGVDVEQIRPINDMQEIAKHFFCSQEAAELMSLAGDERERAFFLCWTRKEAYIKAVGKGLSAPLDSFRVTLRPRESARFIHVEGDTRTTRGWTLHDLQLSPDFAAALAYRDTERPVDVFPTLDPAELLKIILT
jgi:4'-phosphopantetheinyl transferase